jgi:acetyl-CoA carboxylase carboxyl transferase subunit alpha
MKLAEKFRRPVVCFVDTSGAYCGIGAEARGEARALAENLMEMMALKVPVISVLIGEGGSGGALALAVADEVWMLENAVYSVIAPEGCANILWKDPSRFKEAAECLKLTAEDLCRLGVIEKIIKSTGTIFPRCTRRCGPTCTGPFRKTGRKPPRSLPRAGTRDSGEWGRRRRDCACDRQHGLYDEGGGPVPRRKDGAHELYGGRAAVFRKLQRPQRGF